MAVTNLAPRRAVTVTSSAYDNASNARDIIAFVECMSPFHDLSEAGKDGLNAILMHARELLDSTVQELDPKQ